MSRSLPVVAARLLREFWLPGLVAIAWTAYSLPIAGAAWTVKAAVVTFSPAFFLASWATGQFFRVQKQAAVEGRLDGLLARLEKHAQDFIGYSTGAGSVAYFRPMFAGPDVLQLGLMNLSTYPVFDFQADVIDLDEPIDTSTGKLWTRQRFTVESLYPNRAITGAYRFDLRGKDSLSINVFISSRSENSASQQIRLARIGIGFSVAILTTVGDRVVEKRVPPDFPGFDPDNLDRAFEWPRPTGEVAAVAQPGAAAA